MVMEGGGAEGPRCTGLNAEGRSVSVLCRSETSPCELELFFSFWTILSQ